MPLARCKECGHEGAWNPRDGKLKDQKCPKCGGALGQIPGLSKGVAPLFEDATEKSKPAPKPKSQPFDIDFG